MVRRRSSDRARRGLRRRPLTVPPSRQFFEDVRDALVGFLPRALRSVSSRVTGRNLKIWYGEADREHYEVHAIGTGGRWRLEVGWHAEHAKKERNDEVLKRVLQHENVWRKALGPAPEAGRFVGPPGRIWRRISEVWDGANLWGPEAAVEAAARLAEYIEALEPTRRPTT
jgi:hypothetical protein